MKITKTQLRKIIKEELNNVLSDERLNEFLGFGKKKKAAAAAAAAEQAASQRDQRIEQLLSSFPADKLMTKNLYILLNAAERKAQYESPDYDPSAPVDKERDKAMALKALLGRAIGLYEKDSEKFKKETEYLSSLYFQMSRTPSGRSRSEIEKNHDLSMIYKFVLKNMGAG